MSTTTNIADFGNRERAELIDLLSAWNRNGLPENFGTENVHFMFNQSSGYVFLTNSEYEVAMYDSTSGELYQFFTSPDEGKEGSFEDLAAEFHEMNDEDKAWVMEVAEAEGKMSVLARECATKIKDEFTANSSVYHYRELVELDEKRGDESSKAKLNAAILAALEEETEG